MARRGAILTVLLVVSAARAAQAERGAISADLAWGVALIDVRAPYAQGSPSQLGSSFTTSFGLRYALTNAPEVGAAVLYQPSTTFTHGEAQVPSSGGLLPGTLSERTPATRVRSPRASGARLHLALRRRRDMGFATRTFSEIDHFNVSGPAGPRSYGLELGDTSQTELVVAPSAGLEWSGDHFTVGVVPRVDVLGRNRDHLGLDLAAQHVAVLVPVMLSSTLEILC